MTWGRSRSRHWWPAQSALGGLPFRPKGAVWESSQRLTGQLRPEQQGGAGLGASGGHCLLFRQEVVFQTQGAAALLPSEPLLEAPFVKLVSAY